MELRDIYRGIISDHFLSPEGYVESALDLLLLTEDERNKLVASYLLRKQIDLQNKLDGFDAAKMIEKKELTNQLTELKGHEDEIHSPN